jgi:hypothetical protein
MTPVPRRVAIAVLSPVSWSPPGVDPLRWRLALAEDILDVLALLTEVDGAIALPAADLGLASQLGWPGLRSYGLPALDLRTVLTAAAEDGYEQAALLAPDAPDLPGLVIAKLLRPLTSKPVAAAPALGGPGLLGLAANLPVPDWVPPLTLDEVTPQTLRRFAPDVTDVAPASGWHRLRDADGLARLDPRLEGWDATRSLLSATPRDP